MLGDTGPFPTTFKDTGSTEKATLDPSFVENCSHISLLAFLAKNSGMCSLQPESL